MAANNATTPRLKHDVLYEVTRAAWERNLDEKWEQIPYSMILRPQATYHCCIYKEKEIIRQRVRLVGGKYPTGEDTSNVVQVINAACEECPITPYIVTDNCRKYMGKACWNSCNFGAISIERERAYIEPGKCKECDKRPQTCPYNAIVHLEHPYKKVCPADAIIYDEYGVYMIDEEKCIRRGACIHSCPFGAVGSKAFMIDVIRLIKTGKRVVAMVMPTTEEQFGPDITMASWKIALKQLGPADMIGVGLGGDMTAAYKAEEQAQAHKEGKKMTTSCCPASVNMIKQHSSMLLKNMSAAASPIRAMSRMIKSGDSDTVTVFIGLCMAKKSESLDLNTGGNADYAMAFGGIRAMTRAKGVEFQPAENDYQESSVFGKRFGNGGGVIAAVLERLKEVDENIDVRAVRRSGAIECKRALLLIKVGKFSGDFVEGMACVSGCVGDPSRHKTETEAEKAREQLIGSAKERRVLEDLRKYPADELSVHRH